MKKSRISYLTPYLFRSRWTASSNGDRAFAGDREIIAYIDSYDDLVIASGEGWDNETRFYDHRLPDLEDVKSMAVGPGRVAIANQQRDEIILFSNRSGSFAFESAISAPVPDIDFGASIHLSGNVLLVGAPEDDRAGNNVGCVFVYVYQNSSWVLEQVILPPDSAAQSRFWFIAGG